MMPARVTRADLLLAVLVALLAVYLMGFHRPVGQGERVTIQAPGQAPVVFGLDQARTVEVAGLLGETAVAIGGGRVAFVSSPCPHKVCVRRGEISRCGEWIACVPNGVVATITGESDYDGITP